MNITQPTIHEPGPVTFVQYITILMVGSMVVMMAMVHFFATRCNSNSSEMRDQVEFVERIGNNVNNSL